MESSLRHDSVETCLFLEGFVTNGFFWNAYCFYERSLKYLVSCAHCCVLVAYCIVHTAKFHAYCMFPYCFQPLPLATCCHWDGWTRLTLLVLRRLLLLLRHQRKVQRLLLFGHWLMLVLYRLQLWKWIIDHNAVCDLFWFCFLCKHLKHEEKRCMEELQCTKRGFLDW